RALGNLIGLVLLQVVSQGCSFGNLLLLTNRLSPDHYGSLVFAMSIPAVFQAIASGGFAALVVRDLSRNPANADSTITAYVALTGAIGVVCGIGLCGWAFSAAISVEERVLFLWLA